MLDDVLKTVDGARDQTLAGLMEFLRIPSVSTKADHAGDCVACADWLKSQLSAIGLGVQIHPTAGHPIVVAKNDHRSGRPTVLFYGHYDVQPPEPLDKWITPPFEPTVRDGAIYARGAADDKGQVWAHVAALAAWEKHAGLPVNFIAIIEGEEEIGSDHLESFVADHAKELAANIVLISDTNQFAAGIPAITCGLRGLVYYEVVITAADHDLHSGLFGGAVPNPANILCELLATLHDRDGRVTIPGFYDQVRPLSDAERQAWKKLPFDEAKFFAGLKLPGGTGEAGYSTLERRWARPTCDINGLTSGYQGPGAKTIIPSTASAKISMRLVPDQDEKKIAAAFEVALRDRCPQGVKIQFTPHGLAGPVLLPHDSQAIHLAAEAIEIGFGKSPTIIREGGSIPIVGLFKRILGIDSLLVGFALPDDRVHSPNEKFNLDGLHNGARTAAALYATLAQLK
ncbi:MAG TPA: dipeptidase [Tepidisphaeraceae bacterium]|jgi:acetylornithine deacetylase/succinyl-diaminopimelate desuccinylase-like protein|nr:dipeptidase [Tepidisphaeraceae bacterium]